jgi:hypothetical protein
MRVERNPLCVCVCVCVCCYNAHGCICIQNATTLIVIDFRCVAIGVTVIAISSRRDAIGWSSCNSFVSSCNGSDLLLLVPSRCN